MNDDLCACGWSDEEHDPSEHSPEIRCDCQAHRLLMPDLCDNDPKNWDTLDANYATLLEFARAYAHRANDSDACTCISCRASRVVEREDAR
jgi:hypothetical protein